MEDQIQSQARSRRRWKYIIIVELLFVAAIHVISLTSVPDYFVDESLSLSRVLGLVAHGTAVGPMDEQCFKELQDGSGSIPALGYLLYSLPIRLGAAPSIATLRAVNLLFELVMLAALTGYLARVIDPRSAALFVLISGFSPAFFWGAHVARTDALAAALAFTGLALVGIAPERRLSLFAGACLAGLGIACHPRAIIHGISLPVFTLALRGRRFWNPACLGALATGAGLAGVVFWRLQIAPFGDLQSFLEGYRLQLHSSAPPVARGSAAMLMVSLREFYGVLTFLYSWLWPLLLASPFFVACFPDRQRFFPPALLSFTTIILGLLTIHGMIPVKMIMVTPAMELSVAVLFGALGAGALRQWVQSVVITVLMIPVCLEIMEEERLLLLYKSTCAAGEHSLGETLRSAIPPGAAVLAEETYWPHLMEHPYVPWKILRPISEIRGITLEDAMSRYHPEVVLVDGGMKVFLNDHPFDDTFFESLRVPEQEFFAILKRHGSLSRTVESTCHGNIDIWQLSWDLHPDPASGSAPLK